jgi:LDH2 family malate/lactate/ureidoglycolate dehydrogenase
MSHSAGTPGSAPRVSCAELERWLGDALGAAGLTEREAAVTARVLAESDLRGVYSHGSVRLSEYAGLVRGGAWVPGTDPVVVAEFHALVLLDGRHGVGPYIAAQAMERAVTLARSYGVGGVWVRNGGHFGAAAAYSMQAARQGVMGLVCTNTSPAMAPWGGREAVLGNNPWSVAVPAPEGRWPLVLDLANTVVARGKIRAARDRSERIPEGWALDRDGRPTTDPEKALEGTLLPIGGYKGYGIAVVIEVLTAVAAGAALSFEVGSPRDPTHHQGLGQAFLALDVARLQPLDAFRLRMAQLARSLRESDRGPGVERILLPGEPEAARAEEQSRMGIALPAEVRRSLARTAVDLGISAPPWLR